MKENLRFEKNGISVKHKAKPQKIIEHKAAIIPSAEPAPAVPPYKQYPYPNASHKAPVSPRAISETVAVPVNTKIKNKLGRGLNLVNK